MATGYTVDQLAQALITRGGYNSTGAYSAANNAGGRADELAREFLGAGPLAGGGTTGQTLDQQADAILKASQAQWDEETKFLDKYLQDNPFVFDEELAKRAARQEYQPYYTELLGDYMGDVESKRATIQSDRKFLADLRQLDLGQRTRAYTQAIAKAEQGYSGQGMFFSGIKKRALGEAQVEEKSQLAEYERRNQEANLGLSTEEADLQRGEEQQRRNIFGGETALGGLAGYTGGGGQYQTAVEGGIRQRGQEQIQGYNIPLTQAYYRQFPTGSNALAGYTIPDYLQYRA
jgi:hypothetical protein